MLICAMTGKPLRDPSEGIYDDGEWISWDWINSQLERKEPLAGCPVADPALVELFEDFVQIAINYKELTGRYLQVWGELGELFAEVQYGIKRHRPRSPGSDGRLGNDFVEIKTISPEKGQGKVEVKRSGNFNRLLVVRISEDFEFEGRMLDRKQLGKSTSKKARVSWSSMPSAVQIDSDV